MTRGAAKTFLSLATFRQKSPVKTFTGFFITYVKPNDGTTVGGGACTGTALDACVPVMTE